MSNRQQAIIRANDAQVYWCMYESLSFSELTFSSEALMCFISILQFHDLMYYWNWSSKPFCTSRYLSLLTGDHWHIWWYFLLNHYMPNWTYLLKLSLNAVMCFLGVLSNFINQCAVEMIHGKLPISVDNWSLIQVTDIDIFGRLCHHISHFTYLLKLSSKAVIYFIRLLSDFMNPCSVDP